MKALTQLFFSGVLLLTGILAHQSVQAQVISKFTWDSNPVTSAAVGPNATSIGSSAKSSNGGVGGTKGLNPGSPKTDINMIIPNTGGIFNVNNIDISIDYRRNENDATLIQRGTFTFNANNIATIALVYRVNNGTVGGLTISSGDIYNIPVDNTFRNYRFQYNSCTGVGTFYVDNTAIWSSGATPGMPLYWVGDGDIVIGQDMDGAGNNIPNLDNFVLSTFACSPLTVLPVELVSFTGQNEGDANNLKWTTASEVNNNFFTIQKSDDAQSWADLQTVKATGNSNASVSYQVTDNTLRSGIVYYRLTQTDLSGETKALAIVAIDNGDQKLATVVRMTDLLGHTVDESFEGPKLVYYSDGKVIRKMM